MSRLYLPIEQKIHTSKAIARAYNYALSNLLSSMGGTAVSRYTPNGLIPIPLLLQVIRLGDIIMFSCLMVSFDSRSNNPPIISKSFTFLPYKALIKLF